MNNLNAAAMTQELSDVALEYGATGWHVFPWYVDKDGAKHPCIDGWQERATTDPDAIRAMWRDAPRGNIAWIPGKSGHVVVDIDHKDGQKIGLQSWAALQSKYGQHIALTRTIRTQSGGLQAIYRQKPGRQIANAMGNQLGQDIEVRVSIWCALPPSIYRGRPYTWANDDPTIAEFPDELADMLDAARHPQRERPARQSATMSADDLERARTALDRLATFRADDYHEWTHVGMALSELGDAGLDLWEKWSANSPKYREGECVRKWDTFTPGNGITLATLFHMAHEDDPAGGNGYHEVLPEEPEYMQYQPPPDAPPPWLYLGEPTPEEQTTFTITEAVDMPGVTPLTEGANIIPRMGAKPGAKPAECSTWLDLGKAVSAVTWHWERWLSPGFLHLLASKSGMGKSTLALRIAGCYLLGWAWPDGSNFDVDRGAVLWLESESAQALNLQRAGKWGLPVAKILCPFADPLTDVNLTIPRHRAAIEAAMRRDDVKLVILDSLSAALPGRDENDSRILDSMRWLAGLARDTNKPILALHHLRKRSALDLGEEISLDRLRGSSAIVQVSRLVWGLDAPEASQPETLRLQVLKSNLEKFPSPVGLTLNGTITFGPAPEKHRRQSEVMQGTNFLLDLLADGPMEAAIVFSQGETNGLSAATLRRAKDALGNVASVRKGDKWVWTLV